MLPAEHCVGEPPRDPATPTPWQQALTGALTAEVFPMSFEPGHALTRYLCSNLLYQSKNLSTAWGSTSLNWSIPTECETLEHVSQATP